MARILIADDQPIVRNAVAKVIAGSGENWEVCGAVDNGDSAIEEALRLKPDLVILDLRMPRQNGISAGREIRKLLPEVPVLIYTWADAGAVEGVVRAAGLQGVVEKSNGGAILMAIRDVLAGKNVFKPESAAEDVPGPRSQSFSEPPTHSHPRGASVPGEIRSSRCGDAREVAEGLDAVSGDLGIPRKTAL